MLSVDVRRVAQFGVVDIEGVLGQVWGNYFDRVWNPPQNNEEVFPSPTGLKQREPPERPKRDP